MSNRIKIDAGALYVRTNPTFWALYKSTRKKSDKAPDDPREREKMSEWDQMRDMFWAFVPTHLSVVTAEGEYSVVSWLPGKGTKEKHTSHDIVNLFLTLDRIGCEIAGELYYRDEADWFKEGQYMNVRDHLEFTKLLFKKQFERERKESKVEFISKRRGR